MKNVSIARVTVVLSVFLLFGHAAFSESIPSPANSAKEETNSLPVEVSKKIDDAATKMLRRERRPECLDRGGEGWNTGLHQSLRFGRHRIASARDDFHDLQYWIDQQTIHRRIHSSPGRGRQTLA
jgi:hypothetical protein